MIKTCSRCGQAKDSTEYYASGTGKYGLFSFCKECYKAAKRETYARLHKKPDGIRYDSNGRKLMHRGYGCRIYWDGNMLSMLRRHYPTTTNKELADILGVGARTIVRKARELGLKKDEPWQKKMRREYALVANVASVRSGKGGWFKPGHPFYGNKFVNANRERK